MLSTPVVMGILNVTPDSFSDGARLAQERSGDSFRVDLNKALQGAARMVEEGARIIDVGGESTRPGAHPVSLQEELDRVIPVVQVIATNLDVAVSVDTSTPEVMDAACDAGAVMINDIRALQRDGALDIARKHQAAVCLMHMRGEPGTMQQDVRYDNVVDEVLAFIESRVAVALRAGIDLSRLVVDPGFGFGKTLEHNLGLLNGLRRFTEVGPAVLVGLSRKSLFGQITGRPVDQRVYGGIAAATVALQHGARIIRSHDVAATVDAIGVHCALKNAARE